MNMLKKMFGKKRNPRKCRHCKTVVRENHFCDEARREVDYDNDSDFLLSSDFDCIGVEATVAALGRLDGSSPRVSYDDSNDDSAPVQSKPDPEPESEPTPQPESDPERTSVSPEAVSDPEPFGPVELESPEPATETASESSSESPSSDSSSYDCGSSSSDSSSSDSSSSDSGSSSDCDSSSDS